MLRTAAERAAALRAWRREHGDAEAPVEVVAPGTKARRRATLAQKKAVQQALRGSLEELTALDARTLRSLLPALQMAEKELGEQLRKWMSKTPDGELRWSAWKYQAALAHLRTMTGHLEQSMYVTLQQGGGRAQKLSLDHLVHEVARLSEVFGDQVPHMRLNMAGLVAAERSALVPRYRSSAERYAWGKERGVWQDVKTRLAADILAGASVSQTIDALQRDGGPRGLVALQGVAGEEGAIIELIPEGLFARYRSRAETFVRTELAAAYGLQMRQGLYAAREILPDLKRRWCSDGSGCAHICQPMDGQVVGLDQPFIDGEGHTVDDQPAHPRCRCRVGAWRDHWPMLLDSLGLN